jgi:hypothetical protein
MKQSPKPAIPNIEVEDADAAFAKMESLARRVLAVPKKNKTVKKGSTAKPK